jgi:hypothetical protein
MKNKNIFQLLITIRSYESLQIERVAKNRTLFTILQQHVANFSLHKFAQYLKRQCLVYTNYNY